MMENPEMQVGEKELILRCLISPMEQGLNGRGKRTSVVINFCFDKLHG